MIRGVHQLSNNICMWLTMGTHPTRVTMDIVGIKALNQGRSCEEHIFCGSVLKIDTLVYFRAIQVNVKGKEEIALAVYFLGDGVH